MANDGAAISISAARTKLLPSGAPVKHRFSRILETMLIPGQEQ
ncbi:hypothetical protein NHJ13051_001681 [Beauveria bassiana]